MTTITTTGSGRLHLRAERATLRAQINMSSPDRQASIRAARDLHNQIVKLAERLRESSDATWHSADAPSTWVRTWSDDAGTEHRAHVTSSSVSVKLSNLDLASQVNQEWSELGASVGVSWSLTEKTRTAATAQVRELAVQDAAAKAADFARALGRKIVSTVALREESQDVYGGAKTLRASAAAGFSESAAVSIPDITISVDVSADYLTS